MGLESLFAGGDTAEIGYKLAQRIAFFLADNPTDARERFKKVKTCYCMRSKIIHGRWQSDPKIDAVMAGTEGIVRIVFRRLLENPEMLRTFISKSRNQSLEDCGCFPAALIRHHTRPQSDWTGPDLNFSRRRSSTVRAARAATVCRVRPKSWPAVHGFQNYTKRRALHHEGGAEAADDSRCEYSGIDEGIHYLNLSSGCSRFSVGD
jgi:hypothetical protein